jgi:hypothetical protein
MPSTPLLVPPYTPYYYGFSPPPSNYLINLLLLLIYLNLFFAA